MKTALVALILAFGSSAADAQLRSGEPSERSAAASLVRPAGQGMGGSISSFFGLLDPNRFLMRHSFSYSYLTAGGTGLSVASYTNSMFYRIADPLDVRFDVTLQGSPFGPTAGAGRDELSRISLSRAELNYRPWENVQMQVLYRELPWGYYRNPFDPTMQGFLREDGPFDR